MLHKDFYAVVGELVLTSTAIDWQLNRVLIEVLEIGGPLMVEPVVATLDTRLKLEILKERAKHIRPLDWKNGVKKYCVKVEEVFRWRILSATSRRFSTMGGRNSNPLLLRNY